MREVACVHITRNIRFDLIYLLKCHTLKIVYNNISNITVKMWTILNNNNKHESPFVIIWFWNPKVNVWVQVATYKYIHANMVYWKFSNCQYFIKKRFEVLSLLFAASPELSDSNLGMDINNHTHIPDPNQLKKSGLERVWFLRNTRSGLIFEIFWVRIRFG